MKKRLLVVGPTPPPYYGVAIATQSIVESSLATHFDLVHLDTSDRRTGPNFGQLDPMNIWLGVKHVAQIFYHSVFRRPDVVYIPISQGPLAYLRDALFIFIASFAGSKVVLHLRGSFFREFYLRSNPFLQWVMRLSLARADRMIVLGNVLRNLFDGLVSPDRIRVVPNGVDPEEWPIADLASRSKAIPHVCFLGNLYRTKGYFDLIQALAKIREQVPFTCSFAGVWRTDEERDSTLAFIRDNNLTERIRFLGGVKGDGKKALLASADIFAFPSCNEGQPWVILEAMATGLPVVSTDHSTIPENVLDGVTGFIVPPHGIDQLADRLKTLILSPELRVQMGRSSRERLVAEYTKQHFIDRLRQVFEDAIHSPTAAARIGPAPRRSPEPASAGKPT